MYSVLRTPYGVWGPDSGSAKISVCSMFNIQEIKCCTEYGALRTLECERILPCEASRSTPGACRAPTVKPWKHLGRTINPHTTPILSIVHQPSPICIPTSSEEQNHASGENVTPCLVKSASHPWRGHSPTYSFRRISHANILLPQPYRVVQMCIPKLSATISPMALGLGVDLGSTGVCFQASHALVRSIGICD